MGNDEKLALEASPPSTLPPSRGTLVEGTTNSNGDIEAGISQYPLDQRSWMTRLGIGSSSAKSRCWNNLNERDVNAQQVIAETDTRQLESCPEGYPRLGAFLSSESCFSLYRGFGYAHSRVLLDLQEDVAALEKKLDELDREDDETDEGKRRLKDRSFDNRRKRSDEDLPQRKEILDELRKKLLEYDEFLIKVRDLQAFQRPSYRDYKSVRTWMYNWKPLVTREMKFIRKREDIITLRSGREWCTFDGFVESNLKRFDCKPFRWIFCTKELREKTSDKDVHYYSSSRVEGFVGLIITTVAFALLVLPVVAMYQLTSSGDNSHSTFKAIGVLVVFTLLFSAAMSMLTKALRHELFAASAAYCAVLVVFISNLSQVA